MGDNMTTLYRSRTTFTGFPGGPGVATMYFLDNATFVDSLFTFWGDLVGSMPTDVHVQVENVGDVINDVNGELIGSWSQDPVDELVGTSASSYAAPAGAAVSWICDAVLDGHRVVGRTFIVPIAGPNYFTDGSLLDDFVDLVEGSATDLIAAQSESFVVWHRPFPGRAATDTKPAKPAHDGDNALVTSANCADRVAILRSRRP